MRKRIALFVLPLAAVMILTACASKDEVETSTALEQVEAAERIGDREEKERSEAATENDEAKIDESENDEVGEGRPNDTAAEDRFVEQPAEASENYEALKMEEKGEITEPDSKKEEDSVADKDSYVNMRIDELTNNAEYMSSALEQRRDMADTLLKELEQNGYIIDYQLDSLGNLYSFKYSSGLQGGIYLEDFSGKPGELAIN